MFGGFNVLFCKTDPLCFPGKIITKIEFQKNERMINAKCKNEKIKYGQFHEVRIYFRKTH